MFRKLKPKGLISLIIFYLLIITISLLGIAFWIMAVANLMNFHYTGEYLTGISNDVWVRFCYYWIWLGPILGFIG